MSAETRDWTRDIVRLTGESETVRTRAIANLRRTPGIAKTLWDAVAEPGGSRRALALDAIVALKLNDFVPRLLELAGHDGDESGGLSLAACALATSANAARIQSAFRERLLSSSLSPAARIVMLDALARARDALPGPALRRLFDEGSPEERSAVLRYARTFLKERTRQDYLTIIDRALESRPIQVRDEARTIHEELKAAHLPTAAEGKT